VDQLAGTVAFVAHRGGLRGADHLAGQRVTLPQIGHAVATQDSGDRAGRDTELGPDPVLSTALFSAHRHDRFLDLDQSLRWAVMRTRGAVVQTALALLTESVDPAVRALPGDALSLRSMGDRPALLADSLDE
jgi:hypothetical protein